jgi:hypothetical protein
MKRRNKEKSLSELKRECNSLWLRLDNREGDLMAAIKHIKVMTEYCEFLKEQLSKYEDLSFLDTDKILASKVKGLFNDYSNLFQN